MMKKRFSIILILLVLSFVIMLLIVKKYHLKYNNHDNKNNLISVTYCSSEIDHLIERFNSTRYQNDLSLFSLKFKKECVRKTKNGGYLLLKQDDGKEVYIFFDTDHIINGIIRLSKFKTAENYKFLKENETPLGEVLKLEEKIVFYTATTIEIEIFLKDEVIAVSSKEVPNSLDDTMESIYATSIDTIRHVSYEDSYWDIIPIDRE